MSNEANFLLLKNALHDLIKSDYIILDLPYFGNVGDVLIWQATLDLLNNLKYKCLYSASSATYQKPSISTHIPIIFMGGGNFGDLWINHQEFRHKIMSEFPNNPIIQLPQSVHFQSHEYMQNDIKKFAEHKAPITICLRDKKSFDIISENYKTVTPLLLPDMALAFNIEEYMRKHKLKKVQGEGILYVRRTDSEKLSLNETDSFIPQEATIADWPTMENKLISLKLYNKFLNLSKSIHLFKLDEINDILFQNILKDIIIKSGLNFIGKYNKVYTTRLHCGVLAFLMGKDVVMFDNSYGKISGVYNLWLKDQEKIKML